MTVGFRLIQNDPKSENKKLYPVRTSEEKRFRGRIGFGLEKRVEEDEVRRIIRYKDKRSLSLSNNKSLHMNVG